MEQALLVELNGATSESRLVTLKANHASAANYALRMELEEAKRKIQTLEALSEAEHWYQPAALRQSYEASHSQGPRTWRREAHEEGLHRVQFVQVPYQQSSTDSTGRRPQDVPVKFVTRQ